MNGKPKAVEKYSTFCNRIRGKKIRNSIEYCRVKDTKREKGLSKACTGMSRSIITF
jgi:hypothetical protein